MKVLLLVKQRNFFFNKRNFKFKFYKKYFLKNFKNYFFLGLEKILFLNTIFINLLTLFKKKNYKKNNINQRFPIIFNRKKDYSKLQKKNWLLKPFYFYVKRADLNFLLKKKIKQSIKKKKQKKLSIKKKLNKKKIKKRIIRSLRKLIKKFRRLKRKKRIPYIFSKYYKKPNKLYSKLLCSSFSIKHKTFYDYYRSRKPLNRMVFFKFYYPKIIKRLSKKYKNYNKKKKYYKRRIKLFRLSIRWKFKKKLLKILKKKNKNIIFLKKKNLKLNNNKNPFFFKGNGNFSIFFLSFLRSGFSFFSKINLTKSFFFPIHNKNFFIIKKLKPLIKKIRCVKRKIRLKKRIFIKKKNYLYKKKLNQKFIIRRIFIKKRINLYKKKKLNQRVIISRRITWKKKKYYKRKRREMRKCLFICRKRFKRRYFVKYKKLKKFIKFKIKKKNKFCLISLWKLQSFKLLFKNKKTSFFKFYKIKNFNLFEKNNNNAIFLKNYFNFFLGKNSLSNISKTRNFKSFINPFINNLLYLNFLYKILFKVNVFFKFNFFLKKFFKPILVSKRKISLTNILKNVFNKSKMITQLKAFSKKLFRKKLYRYKFFLKRKLKNLKDSYYRYKKTFKRKYNCYFLRLKSKFIGLRRNKVNYKKLSKFLFRLKKTKNRFKKKIFIAIFKIILRNYKKKLLKKTINSKIIFNLKKKLYPKIQKKNSIKVIFKNKNQKKFRSVDFIKFKRNKFSFKFFDYFSKLVNLFIKKLFLSTIKHGKKEKAFFFLTFCAKRFKKKKTKQKLTFFDFMRVVFEKLDSAGAAKNIPFLKKGISRREDFYDSFKLDNRRLKYPIMWIISSARSRTTEKGFSLKLFNELYDIYRSKNCETLKKLKDFNKNVIYTRHTQGRFRRKFVSRSRRFQRRWWRGI